MRVGVRSRASADSSFSASSTASCTKRLTASSPHGPSTPRPKPPANPLTPAKPMPCTSTVSPSSSRTPASVRIVRDLGDGARLVVVIAEHADDRNLDAADQFARKLGGFFGQAVVGQVAAQQQDVGFGARARR